MTLKPISSLYSSRREFSGSLLSRMCEACIHNPDRIILSDENYRLTFAEFDHITEVLAARIVAQPGDFVFTVASRSIWHPIFFWSCIKAGKIYAPIDPDLPTARIEAMLQGVNGRQVFAQSDLDDKLLIQLRATPRPSLKAAYSERCFLLYTSGSTGTPKGIIGTQTGLFNRMQWALRRFTIDESDTVLFKTPVSFDVHLWEIVLPFMTGARLEVLPERGHRNLARLVTRIETLGITRIHFVPSVLRVFLRILAAGRCANLRSVFCSGEELTVADATAFYEKIPTARLHNLYGPAEASVDVTHFEVLPDDLSGRVRLPIGLPIDNVDIYLLDAALRAVDAGCEGEIYIAGPALAEGYTSTELSARAFILNPYDSSNGYHRLYRTGDIGRIDAAGQLEYLGRTDSQVKVNGVRIELREIEAVLKQFSGIEDAVAVFEKEQGQIHAFITGRVDQADLASYLSSRLPSTFVPTSVQLLMFMPLNQNGKLDLTALRARIRKPQSDADA